MTRRPDEPDDYDLKEDERELHALFALLRDQTIEPLRDLSQAIRGALEAYLEAERAGSPSVWGQLRDMSVELVNLLTGLIPGRQEDKADDEDDHD